LPRLFKPFFSKGVGVILDLVEAERIFGERLQELLPSLVEKVIEECFIKTGVGKPLVKEEFAYIRFFKPGVGPDFYGFVERSIDMLEKYIYFKFGVEGFSASVFISRNPLQKITIVLYNILGLYSRQPTPEGYKTTARIANSLHKMGFIAAEYSFGVVGIVKQPGLKYSEEIGIGIRGETYKLVSSGEKRLNFARNRDRIYVKKIMDRFIRDKFRKLGYIVKGLRAFENYSRIVSNIIEVRPGFEYQLDVLEDGYVILFLSPRYMLTSSKTLWEEYGSRGNLLRSKKELVGLKVRRVTDGSLFVIEDILESRVTEKISQLETTVYDMYRSYGEIDVREPIVVVSRGGALEYIPPSLLKRVIDQRSLRKLGLSKSILRETRPCPEEWVKKTILLMKSINPVGVDPLEVYFLENPLRGIDLHEIY